MNTQDEENRKWIRFRNNTSLWLCHREIVGSGLHK